jgi:hypothetical protein
MTTTIRWVGTGEPLVADVRHRELFCYGERAEGEAPRVHKCFALEGWAPVSVVELLVRGGSSGATLVEVEPATVKPAGGFDRPEGEGVGTMIAALERILLRPTSPLAAAAAALAGFHTHPTWFEQLHRAIGGGNPVWSHRLRVGAGERALVRDNTHWKSGAPSAAASHEHERHFGPRPQVTGWRVLDEGQGSCPECGAALVKTAAGPICESMHRKQQMLSAPGVEEPSEAAAEMLGLMAEAFGRAVENSEPQET